MKSIINFIFLHINIKKIHHEILVKINKIYIIKNDNQNYYHLTLKKYYNN